MKEVNFMATVINPRSETHTHPVETDTGTALGFFLGLILLVAIGILLFGYVLPRANNNTGGTRVNVPDRIDVNVNPRQ